MTLHFSSRRARSRLTAILLGVAVIVTPTLGGLGLVALFDMPARNDGWHPAPIASAMPPALPDDLFDAAAHGKQRHRALPEWRHPPR